MANTYTLINSYSATGTVASIDFTSISSTYTDLVLKLSLRGSGASTNAVTVISYNGLTTNLSYRQLQGNGATASSTNGSSGATAGRVGYAPDGGSTASTFNNIEVYIPNYAGSFNKSYSSDSVQENNSATAGNALVHLIAGLWTNTSAINRITITIDGQSIVANSTAYLYGVSKS